MGDALLSGVTGLRIHQQMLDVSGNNLANVNTNGYKASRILFSDLLNQTLQDAGQPTERIGGTNPMQIGSGAQVAAIDRDMNQGGLVTTGQPLDMAIEGAGFFVIDDGSKDLYTRVGSFGVDSQFYLVDPATGYRVQRIGSEGVAEGFQVSTRTDIRIPYDVALAARGTETVTYTGNLSADEDDAQTQIITSGLQYTVGGAVASESSLLEDLDQASGIADGDQIDITVTRRDGTQTTGTLTIDAGVTDVQDLLDQIGTLLGGDATVGILNGEVRVSETRVGSSQIDTSFAMASGATGTLEVPNYFKILTAGGESVRNTNVEIFDSQGVGHMMSAAFCRSSANNWDVVITAITGDVELVKRRIEGVSFHADGSYGGLSGGDTPTFQMRFEHDPTNTRSITINLGTIGEFVGLSQFGGASTVAPSGQDGFASGYLTSLSVTREGILTGVFNNGVRRDLAAMKIATFQNPGGLEAVGNNMFIPTANSGDPVTTKALSGGAGSIRGSSLERSNVEVAAEFVNLIQAQNGYQANARTIRIANDMLRELATLIR
jgi:flagellar hook protein FlgE